MKSEGERDRYIQLNAEFQRIARRDKKAFFKEQCSITEKNNKKGKTRDLFRKTGNIKGIFNPKMGTIKDKNGKDLVDAEEIKKRWKEYMEELYKKILMNRITVMMYVVSHPKSDVLECKAKWALRSTAVNKASACDEIPAEQFRSLKDNAIKVLHSICQQSWKTQQWPTGLKNVSPHPSSQEG